MEKQMILHCAPQHVAPNDLHNSVNRIFDTKFLGPVEKKKQCTSSAFPGKRQKRPEIQ
jgi:hypothetical protein